MSNAVSNAVSEIVSTDDVFFNVDLSRAQKRQVTFQNNVCDAFDVMVREFKVSDKITLKPFVATVTDLNMAIPNFPDSIDCILGTNALEGYMVQFQHAQSPRFIAIHTETVFTK